MKTYTACPSRYKHNNSTKTPAERRAGEIEKNYVRKFKNLDKKFAADVVGDGNNNIVGPFEAAQGRFYRGQVIPLCVLVRLGRSTKTLIRSYDTSFSS